MYKYLLNAFRYVFQFIDLNNKLLTAFIFYHMQTCAIYLLNMTDSCIKRERKGRQYIFMLRTFALCTRSVNYQFIIEIFINTVISEIILLLTISVENSTNL